MRRPLLLALGLAVVPALLPAQYSGGPAAGVINAPRAAIRLDGLALDMPFLGGEYNGETEGALPAAGLSGEDRRSMVSGGPGRGERLTDRSLVLLDGNGVHAAFLGGAGRGDRDVPMRGSTLGGEAISAAFAGAAGRGEILRDQAHLNLAGITLGIAFGGPGRGEHEAGAAGEILDCSHYAVWTGLVSTAWADPANWQCNELPNRYSDVVIPGTAPHFPQITSGPVEIRNLHLQSNSALQALGALLRVLGGDQ